MNNLNNISIGYTYITNLIEDNFGYIDTQSAIKQILKDNIHILNYKELSDILDIITKEFVRRSDFMKLIRDED